MTDTKAKARTAAKNAKAKKVKDQAEKAAEAARKKVLAEAEKKTAAAEKTRQQKEKKLDQKRKAAEGEKKAKVTTALRKLAPFAKEINTRLEKAAKMEDNAYDHRLAAALQLDKAKKQAEADKIPFKKWCEENVLKKRKTT